MKLGLEGNSVVRVCFDGAVTLLTSASYELRVETGATIEVFGEGALGFEPNSPGSAAIRLVDLVGKTVSRAEASDIGGLTIRFDDHIEFVAPPHDSYEAWSINGPRQERIVCMPGGELAIWSKAEE